MSNPLKPIVDNLREMLAVQNKELRSLRAKVAKLEAAKAIHIKARRRNYAQLTRWQEKVDKQAKTIARLRAKLPIEQWGEMGHREKMAVIRERMSPRKQEDGRPKK